MTVIGKFGIGRVDQRLVNAGKGFLDGVEHGGRGGCGGDMGMLIGGQGWRVI